MRFAHIKTLASEPGGNVVLTDTGRLCCKILHFIQISPSLDRRTSMVFDILLSISALSEVVTRPWPFLPVLKINDVVEIGLAVGGLWLTTSHFFRGEAFHIVLPHSRYVLGLRIQIVQVVTAFEFFGLAFACLRWATEVGMRRVDLEVFPFVVALSDVEHVSNLQRRVGMVGVFLG